MLQLNLSNLDVQSLWTMMMTTMKKLLRRLREGLSEQDTSHTKRNPCNYG